MKISNIKSVERETVFFRQYQTIIEIYKINLHNTNLFISSRLFLGSLMRMILFK